MEKANKFIEEIGAEEMDSAGAAELIDFAIGLIPSDVKSVLCVGFGSGYELEKIEERGCKVKGVDYNQKNIERTKDLFDVKQMDMHDLKFKDKSSDLVFARDVFEHATSHITAFSEMARVSKKYILITLPDNVWALSLNHTLIPTLKQMITLGIRFNYALDYFYERFHQSKGIWKEYYYIFRRKE